MKSFFVNLVVAACAFHEGAAFSTLPPSSSRPSSMTTTDRPSSPPLKAASLDNSNRRSEAATTTAKPPTSAHEQREMETIRTELIEKYISLGHSEEYAGHEVAYFLADSERSKQYVDMRRIAMAGGNDLGIENIVQFAAAFLVGVLGSWALNYMQEIQAASPDTWIS
mmetsp:Transcript_25674/g.53599  ORF Transcript_25674/g.53599 Transcript_25674/m.53599 type:complete len:167 (-) Transcript_25674:338-838(-)